MKTRFSVGLFLLLWMILSCAAPPQKPTELKVPIDQDPFSVIPQQYRSKALECEKNGELPKALQNWEIVSSFMPTDEAVAKRIVELKSQILALADQHFKRGLGFYQGNSI